jgi:hypothetical protein
MITEFKLNAADLWRWKDQPETLRVLLQQSYSQICITYSVHDATSAAQDEEALLSARRCTMPARASSRCAPISPTLPRPITRIVSASTAALNPLSVAAPSYQFHAASIDAFGVMVVQ